VDESPAESGEMVSGRRR